ncbi:hypothetical protein ACK3SF_00470 [Candidatus Nanosalina sp. VS9-1]|uniref:hypothetical protein n=1 Tax=Candidatus Nanosalina sp. VS9-1 TaxID=3388566 RepID=UPI0039E16E32
MKRKILALSGFLTSITASASAQVTGGSGEITSVFAILGQVLGIDIGNPYSALALLATLGIMSLSTYIVLKEAFKKMDMLDTVLPGSGRNGGGRNILALLSVLITLTIFGTGAAAGIIQGFQAIFLLGFVFMMIGGGVFIMIGGSGMILGGGSKAMGKFSKDAAEGISEGMEAVGEIDDILGTAEREAQDGAENNDEEEEEEAAERIERALELMNEVLVNTAGDLDSKRNEVTDAVGKVEEAIGLEEDEFEQLGYIDQRFKRANIFLHEASQVVESSGPGGSDLLNGEGAFNLTDDWSDQISIGALQGIEGLHKNSPGMSASDLYGLAGVREDFEKINQSLDMMTEELSEEEGDMAEAFQELVDAVEAAVGYHEILQDLGELLDEAERDDEMLEQLAQSRDWRRLYNEADHEEDEERQLENRKAEITGEEDALRSELNSAVNLLKKHLQEDDRIIQEIRNELENDERSIEDALSTLSGELEGTGYESALGELDNMLASIEARIERIEDEDINEEQREREVIQQAQQHLEG